MERRDASAEAGRTGARSTARAAARWAAALTAAGLALTGCGAGQNAQTSEMKPAIAGVDVNAGSLALRDLQVDFGESGSYPEGGAAPLRVWIANEGDQTVVLEAVTSPDAEAVTLATEVVVADPSESPSDDAPAGGDESASPDETASETPTGDASPTAEATEGDEGSAELLGERVFAIEIKPKSYVRLAPVGGSFLMLEGLKQDVGLGSTVEVVFTFSDGATATAHLPVGQPAVAPSRSYYGDPHEEH
ncbi:copper chaperone PCu(A)C [Glycomyces harbinensis]|uniref:Copper(I)-binding protein n=1 Tax=Glycomyces harbinensis TaxID=58114 RepID=A0A1G6RPE5_9ACTN|nr:copper chaperone PCu(A)C [Glycomyces harbinensis]SDD05806.1 Protein of unknown function [Glycomyces harbinensis]